MAKAINAKANINSNFIVGNAGFESRTTLRFAQCIRDMPVFKNLALIYPV